MPIDKITRYSNKNRKRCQLDDCIPILRSLDFENLKCLEVGRNVLYDHSWDAWGGRGLLYDNPPLKEKTTPPPRYTFLVNSSSFLWKLQKGWGKTLQPRKNKLLIAFLQVTGSQTALL